MLFEFVCLNLLPENTGISNKAQVIFMLNIFQELEANGCKI